MRSSEKGFYRPFWSDRMAFTAHLIQCIVAHSLKWKPEGNSEAVPGTKKGSYGAGGEGSSEEASSLALVAAGGQNPL